LVQARSLKLLNKIDIKIKCVSDFMKRICFLFKKELPLQPIWAIDGCSSIGRVVVSKTIGWEFESLHPCKI
jgi:hypothetical protein